MSDKEPNGIKISRIGDGGWVWVPGTGIIPEKLLIEFLKVIKRSDREIESAVTRVAGTDFSDRILEPIQYLKQSIILFGDGHGNLRSD